MSIFIIAEIGINHNGDVKIAKKLIDNAKNAGADAVKFQKRTIDLVYSKELLDEYRESPWGITQRAQKEGLEFGLAQYQEIDAYCKQKEIEWFASAWDLESVKFLRQFDLKYNKIASAMIIYEDFLKKVALERKHTFISTGMADTEDIDGAVDIFRKADCPFELMHCVGFYPITDEDANLNCIKTLRERYKCKVGYSGHEVGLAISYAAAALGISSLERHITISRAMYGSDQPASIEEPGFRQLVGAVRKIEKATGNGLIKIIEQEDLVANKLRAHIPNTGSYSGMKNMAVIPARSESQRITHKNVKLVAGYPLIYYQIECAKQIQEIQKIIVATDNMYYAEIAESLNIDVVMRPADISGPDSKTEETLLYVIDTLEKQGELFDNVILLQPTNPLNKPEYIQKGIDFMKSGKFKSVLTYCDFTGFLLDDRDIIDRPMTQNRRPRKMETGCFWITNIKALRENNNRICEPYARIEVSKIASLEIDTPDDLKIIESLLEPAMRIKDKRYFEKRTYSGDFEEYYGPKLDPDGKLRDITKEKDHKIEFCKDEIKFINNLASDGKKRNLLDLGCGAGFVFFGIVDAYNKYGLEVSKKAAALAKKYADEVHIGYLEEDTYPADFFDVVFCHHVIEHVEDPVKFITIINKIIKMHGHLIISSPNFDSGVARRYGEKYRLLHDESHISLFSDFSLKMFLEDYGFIVDKVEYPFFETEYFTKESLLRLFDLENISPPFYGNIMTFYGRKK